MKGVKFEAIAQSDAFERLVARTSLSNLVWRQLRTLPIGPRRRPKLYRPIPWLVRP